MIGNAVMTVFFLFWESRWRWEEGSFEYDGRRLFYTYSTNQYKVNKRRCGRPSKLTETLARLIQRHLKKV